MPVVRLPRRPGAREIALTAAVLAVANLPLVRTWMLHFGATEAELDAELPGDEQIGSANLVATRAVTIDATPQEVWRWLVQIGQGRGGFYSYDWLENLAGCQIRSADRVEARWQQLEPTDEIALHPAVRMRVCEVNPERSLVMISAVEPGAAPAPYEFSWAFVLRRGRGGTTRLLVRERYGYRSGWSALVAEPTAAVSFVMTEKMLRGIRDRAEGSV
jgi:hypothetical protein